MENTPTQVEIIITEAQTPHETENIWEKEFELQQQKELEAKNAEDLEEARKEAEQFVSDVITKATEIVTNGNLSHDEQENSSVSVGQEISSKNEDDEDTRKELMKNDPELVEKARSFVATVLDKAIEEAQKRSEQRPTKDSSVAFDDNIATDLAPAAACFDPERKPWYLRARSSVCRFFHRVCMCFRSRDDR